MVYINDTSASFRYNEQNLFQSIVDKTLYAVKYMAKIDTVDDNVLTYSLSHDEKDYVTENIAAAIGNIKKLISETTFYSPLADEKTVEGEVGFTITTKYGNHLVEINPNKGLIMDSFSEMYIINYVLTQWAKLISVEKLAESFEVQTTHCLDGITSLLSQFTTLPEVCSYEII